MAHPPALALVEIASLSRAYVVLDAVVKKATVTVVTFDEVSPGKTLLVMMGGEGEVEESRAEARILSGNALLDLLMLPAVHPSVVAAMRAHPLLREAASLGIVETRTAAAAVRGADAGLKAADVELIRLKLARGIGGKGLVLFTGDLHHVEAAMEAACQAAAAAGDSTHVLGQEIVAQPHPEILGHLTAQ
jgi:microcompartment protein CcmL/EutN